MDLKCRTSFRVTTNVIYQFKCLCDTYNSYIDETKHHLTTQVKEHLRSKGVTQTYKQLSKYVTCKQGNLSLDNFEILIISRTDETIYVQN